MSFFSNAVPATPQVVKAKTITHFTSPSIQTAEIKILYCDVIFGLPSADCRGTGICKINGTHQIRPSSLKKDCKLTIGQIAAGPDGQVSLYFFREFLCTTLYKAHFRKGILKMEEPCPFPAALSRRLGVKGKALLAGDYKVVEGDGYFRVDISLG